MKKYVLALFIGLVIMAHFAALAQPAPKDGRWKTTSKTTKVEVTSGGAVSLPLVVSLVALVSALASVAFSLKVKDKEYRNDYFKKVIEKRLKSVEQNEVLIGLLSTYTFEQDDARKLIVGVQCHTNLYEDPGRELIQSCKNTSLETALWDSPKSELLYNELSILLTEILIATAELDLDGRFQNLSKSFEEIETLKIRLEASLNEDMATLYDVESFFKEKRAYAASMLKESDKGKRLTRSAIS